MTLVTGGAQQAETAVRGGLAERIHFAALPRCFLAWSMLIAHANGLAAEPSDVREIFRHSDVNRCGPYALQICAEFLDVPIRQSDVTAHLPYNGRVTTFSQLKETAEQLGLKAVPVRWSGRPYVPRSAPAILSVQYRGAPHYFAALGRDGDRFLIVDFPSSVWMDTPRLREEFHWQGEALHISTNRFAVIWLKILMYHRQIAVTAIVGAAVVWILVNGRAASRSRMRSAAGVILAAAYLSGGCAPPSELDSAAAAVRLDPPQLTINLSDDPDENGEVATEIRVVNDGRNTVKILQTIASCGCTSIDKPSATVIAPGELAKFPLRVELPDVGVKKTRLTVLVENGKERRTLNADILLRGREFTAPSLVRMPSGILQVDGGPDGHATTMFRVRTHERQNSSHWIQQAIAEPHLRVTLQGVEESATSQPEIVHRIYTYEVQCSSSAASLAELPLVRLVAGDSAAVGEFRVKLRPWQPLQILPRMIYASLSDEESNVQREIRVVLADQHYQPVEVTAHEEAAWFRVKSVTFDGERREAKVLIEFQTEHLPDVDTIRGSLTVTAADKQRHTATQEVPIVVRMKRSA